ncbi:MAG: tetratricopeptide repeat protein [Abitibacteriaceae bacterium]|nr:tetratricopeptide repeat protein [Abditibacteriaceae bacterium]
MASGVMETQGWQTGLDTLVQGRVKEAVSQLRAFVQRAPESFEGHYFLGTALNQAGRYGEAVAALQNAVSLNPKHGQACYQLGLALHGLQEPELARQQFEKAVQLDPTHEPSRAALAHLNEVVPASPVSSSTVLADSPGALQVAALDGVEAARPGGSTLLDGMAGATPHALAPTTPVMPSPLAMPLMELREAQPPKLGRAFLFGLTAALMGALLWDMGCISIHEHVDGIAVALGAFVGWAVAEGADTEGRSAIGVQLIAIFLTAVSFCVGEACILMGYTIVYAAMAGVALNIPATFVLSVTQLPAYFIHAPTSFFYLVCACGLGWLQSSRIWR